MHGLRPLLLLFVLGFVTACGSAVSEGGDDTFSAASQISTSVSEGHAPLTVEFIAEGASGAHESGWDFGDGTQTDAGPRTEHTFLRSGTYEVTYRSENEDGSHSRVLSTTVIVHPNVNLVVSNFAIPRTITPGALTTVSATIENIGTDALEANGILRVGYFLSTDESVTVDDIRIGDTSIYLGSNALEPGQHGIAALGPQERYTYNHQLYLRPNIPGGTYYVAAIVDYLKWYEWYSFPSATDTVQYQFPVVMTVEETDASDNVSLLLMTESAGDPCTERVADNHTPGQAQPLGVGETQLHNLCFNNADWFYFEALEGEVYQITTVDQGDWIDTQLILYEDDAETIVLFHDNFGNGPTTDLSLDANLEDGGESSGTAPNWSTATHAEIVWRAPRTGRYYIKVRTATCDEHRNPHCEWERREAWEDDQIWDEWRAWEHGAGVGTGTDYSITLR